MDAAVGAVEFDGDEIDNERAASFRLFVRKIFGIVDAAVGSESRRDDLIALQIAGGTRRADDLFCVAARSGNGDEVVPRVGNPGLTTEECAGAARDDDRGTVRRPGRMNVLAHFFRQLLRRRTVAGDFPGSATEAFVPRSEYDEFY